MIGLLVLSTLMFTSFFREGEGGLLHGVKGAITSVVAPVQDVAVAAVQPFRDAWNWFAELRDARDERNRLRAENEELRSQLTGRKVDAERLRDYRQLLAIQDEAPTGYRPVTASIINRPPIDIAKTARIDRGRDDGVTVNSLVFVPKEGTDEIFGTVVGLVERVDRTSAEVTFLTDPRTAVAATTLGSGVPLGLLKANASGQLVLSGVPGSIAIAPNDTVVTLGAGTADLPSPYPPGLPIGYVSSQGRQEPGATQAVQVTPFRDPSELDTVMVFVPRSAAAKRRAGIG